MKNTFVAVILFAVAVSCLSFIRVTEQKKRAYEGTFGNGYKGAKISFTISPDGKELQDLTFKGYWKCASGIEQTTVGPKKNFAIVNGKIDGVVTDPEGGGSTAWRFELHGTIDKGTAQGTFRMNINNLGCDTYKLNWTAAAK
jgi:hypothetical protein